MQAFQVLHLLSLILLTTSIEAQDFSNSRCGTRCGNVIIPYPFGIGRFCSASEWYSVDCNSSTPYLSAFHNVEVLNISPGTVNTVVVDMSMIRADCKNPIKNSNLVLSKSPFRISGSRNRFVVEGCGSAAIMKNGSIVAGCSTTCDKDTASDLKNCFGVGCCQTAIPHALESFTFNLTGLERYYDNGTCGSAFFLDIYYANRLSTTLVPVSLSWDETFVVDSFTMCNETCGDVLISYPFGIEKNCSASDWFNVDCKSSTPYLSAFNNLQVLGVSLESKTVTVNVSTIADCENPIHSTSLVRGSPFHFSAADNIFVVEGCGNAAIMKENGIVVSGCSTTCHNDTVTDTNNCFGIGCCQTTIPYDLKSFTYNLTGLERQGRDRICGHAFLVNGNSFIEGRFSGQFIPTTLGWEYGSKVDNYTYGTSYEVSTECTSCKKHGGYCFPGRYLNSNMTCFYESNKKSHVGVILGVSISMGIFFLTVITYALCKIIKKTKLKRKKQRCFKRNGGLLLKQQEATHAGLVDKTILFTSNELEKATDHFNENRILGRGGQGTVYKGMLADGRIVAIKKSKVVDESQLQQFINEVVILSQVNHRNVVRLLGCCLETEVPLLVSEFISNGTLYDLLQEETGEFSISLSLRLQIATEVAGAVSYLHSATSIPIYHRDIKTTNILLDEKYRAKVSDFGTSRFVSVDQTHLTTLVKGTFGYLDPEYFQSSHFTEKSDVYSFGVVLLELLTREKPISLTRFGENRSLATHFLIAMEKGRVMSIFDAMVVQEGSTIELLAVADLAMRCLNFNGRNRPTMKEVAIELEGIRLSHVPSTVETNFGHARHCEEVPLTYDASTSMIFDHNPNQ